MQRHSSKRRYTMSLRSKTASRGAKSVTTWRIYFWNIHRWKGIVFPTLSFNFGCLHNKICFLSIAFGCIVRTPPGAVSSNSSWCCSIMLCLDFCTTVCSKSPTIPVACCRCTVKRICSWWNCDTLWRKNGNLTIPIHIKSTKGKQNLKFNFASNFCNLISFANRMTKDDMKFFPSDTRNYNWEDYRYNYHLGLLRYIGQDTLDEFGPARKRMFRFKIAHFFVLIVYYSFLASIYYFFGELCGINNSIRSWFAQFSS